MADSISVPDLKMMRGVPSDSLAAVKTNLYSLFLEQQAEAGHRPDPVVQQSDSLMAPNNFSPMDQTSHFNHCESEDRFQVVRRRDQRDDIRRTLFQGRTQSANHCVYIKAPKLLKLGNNFRSSNSFNENQLTRDDQDDVMQAVDRFVDTENLTGDGSRRNCLPTVKGAHFDLKYIAPETMADLLLGTYDDVIRTCSIIDCRYPYEYRGGRVTGADNLFMYEHMLTLLRRTEIENGAVGDKRNLLIFYCEFSSKRAPRMLRYLRSKDREQNRLSYPSLNFPEIYLLYGGYNAFFEKYKCHCEPMDYIPMIHKNHTEDLRHFRIKSQSWTAGEKRRAAWRLRL